MESHLISGLKALRVERLRDLREIEDKIVLLEAAAAAKAAMIAHVDGVLGDVAPELVLETVRPKGPRRISTLPTGRGDDKREPVSRFMLRTLRETGLPTTADEMIALARASYPDQDAVKLTNNVRTQLSQMVRSGALRTVDVVGDGRRYAINSLPVGMAAE